MSQPPRRHTHAFVLRLWREADGRARGQLEHVASREVVHFQDQAGLLRSMARWVPEFAGGEPRVDEGEP